MCPLKISRFLITASFYFDQSPFPPMRILCLVTIPVLAIEIARVVSCNSYFRDISRLSHLYPLPPGSFFIAKYRLKSLPLYDYRLSESRWSLRETGLW